MAINQSQANGRLSFVDDLTSKRLLSLDPIFGGINLDHVIWDDHFLGDALDARYSGAKGSDAEGAAPAIVQGAQGICALVSGDAGTGTAADGSSLTAGLNWQPSLGGVYLRARGKFVNSVANVCANIGFTDVLATTTLEMPFTISGTTITSNATDAVCHVFDTAQTTDNFMCQGVKNNTDTALLNSTVAPTADTFFTAEIVIDANGTATYYINEVLVGQVANAVTPSVALTPIVAIEARTTTSRTFHLDRLTLAQVAQ